MAPTRQTAQLCWHAHRAGAKVIAAGDAGQLPSVTAGGWFASLSRSLGGPELREMVRQRDPHECQALGALHDGDPDGYLVHKQRQATLAIHPDRAGAELALLAGWDHARRDRPLSETVMIAADNGTRATLNDRARAILKADGAIAPTGIMLGGRELCVGDRVIARRNDRRLDVDNGTRGTITAIRSSGAVVIRTDSGAARTLDPAYAAEHLEHAYALTAHGAQGATVS